MTPSRWPAANARTAALAILIALTSLAVGATTSPWLVPAYLVTMGWLLLAPSRPVSASPASPAPEVQAIQSEFAAEPEAAPAAEAEAEAIDPTPAEESPKPKKARSRGKGKARTKAKAEPAPEPRPATWVQVAPGKFVRVEAPEPGPEEEGPHLPPEEEPRTAAVEELVPTAGEAPLDETSAVDLASVEADHTPEVPMVELAPVEIADVAEVSTEEPTPEESASEEFASKESTSPSEGPPVVLPSSEDAIPAWREPEPAFEEDEEAYAACRAGFDGPSWDDVEPPPIEEAPAVISGIEAAPVRPGFLMRRHAAGAPRAFRLRRDPRPKPRRATGRVGASPRVNLSRS